MDSDYLLGIFKLFLSIIAYMFERHDTVEILQKLALITNHSIIHVCFIFTDGNTKHREWTQVLRKGYQFLLR
jgi:hypothetical protein